MPPVPFSLMYVNSPQTPPLLYLPWDIGETR